MSSDKIWLFDTTLRDGGQTRGVDFSRADKIAIANALDNIEIILKPAGQAQTPQMMLFLASRQK